MRVTIVFLFCIFLSWAAGPSAADHHHGLKIIGFPKEGRLEIDGSGPYADLVRAILKQAGYDGAFIATPVLRALRYFETEGEVCLVPTSKIAITNQFPTIGADKLIASEPIDYITGHLVTRPGTKPIRNPAEIDGKIMAAWVGVNVNVFFPNIDFTLLKTESEENAIRLLHNGRVDVIWSWIPDAYILYEQMGLGEPVLAEDSPIFGSSAHFTCHRTARTEQLISRIDLVINEMRTDGRLKKILGKHARIIGIDVPMPKTLGN
ncbi:MAG: substrate-binding periplasmic protein [Kordiimonas sp.]